MFKTAPKVTVLMNCYNSATYLKEAIDSVYAQEYTDWEMVFFDNNSIDNSAEIAKSYDQKVRYYKNDKTLSLGAARNKALQFARGEYIAILDCDDVWAPQKLALQMEAFAKHQILHQRAAGLCYSDALRIDSLGKELVPFSREKKLYTGNVYKKLILSPFIACSSCVIKKSALEVVGTFDESLDYVEEWDLWIRIAKEYDVILVDAVLEKARIHEKSSSSINFEGQFLEKLRLSDMIINRDPLSRKEASQLRRESIMQYKISKLFFSKSAFHLFVAFPAVLIRALFMPITTLSLVKRHLKRDLINAFKVKYFGNKAHS